jgi:hypothetical protein
MATIQPEPEEKPITLFVNPTAVHFALQAVDFAVAAHRPGFEDVQPKLMKLAANSFDDARNAERRGL